MKIKNFLIIILTIIIFFLARNIFLNIFFNNKIVIVPNVVEKTKIEAIEILKAHSLKYKLENEVSDDEIVKIQNPVSNTKVKSNRVISLFFDKNEGKKIPNILGMPLVKAERKLNLAGIRINRIDYYPTNGENDIIISTYPDINEMVGKEGISLLVSINNLETNNIMPNLIGMKLEDAISTIKAMNKEINDISYISDNTKEINTILYTEPVAGDKIENYISVVVNKIDIENYNKEIDKIIKENLEELNKEESENNVPSNKKD